MAVQTTVSSLAKRLGNKLTQAHQKSKDAPVSYGRISLPGGIRNGIAQLATAYVSEYKDGELKGLPFFRASGTVISPEAVGETVVKGLSTSIIIPLCDDPKTRKNPKTFDENWYDFQNWFKQFGVNAPDELDPYKIEAYYVSAMKMLVESKPAPYFTFSTRSWTPPKTPANPKPSEMVFEEWHRVTKLAQVDDPSAGVTIADGTPDGLSPEPFNEFDQPPTDPPTDNTAAAPTEEPEGGSQETTEAVSEIDLSQIDLPTIIEMANADPDAVTDEGRAAILHLTELARAAGKTDEEISSCKSWSEVAELFASEENAEVPQPPVAPTKGSFVHYQLKGADGKPVLGKDKKPAPPVKCEVTSVNEKDQTVTLKNTVTKLSIVGPDKKLLKVSWSELSQVE